MRPLTEKQAAVLAFVRAEIATKGKAPTASEVAKAIGVRSISVASAHLWALERKGYLKRALDVPRGARLTVTSAVAMLGDAVVVRDPERGRRGLFWPVVRPDEQRRAA